MEIGGGNKISCRREKKYSYYVKHSIPKKKKKVVVLLSKASYEPQQTPFTCYLPIPSHKHTTAQYSTVCKCKKQDRTTELQRPRRLRTWPPLDIPAATYEPLRPHKSLFRAVDSLH